MTWKRVWLGSLHLHHDAEAMTRFLGVLSPIWDDPYPLLVDLTTCRFLNAEGAALLAAFVLYRRRRGLRTEIDWATGEYGIRRQLGRWRLAELFNQVNFPWTDTAIPLLHQERLDGLAVEEYIGTVIRAGDNMPVMTPLLIKETTKDLCELFANVFQHAASTCGGLAIGQYYPNVRQVQFCVCDVGVGLVERVRGSGYSHLSPGQAIQWALGEGHSTGNRPGGLGLYWIQEFVKANGGTFRIIANDGYYEQTGADARAFAIRTPYRGTLIQIGLHVREGEIYALKERGRES